MLILFTGGNTSFTGFPFLASFAAEDSYLPRQLTKRGHRLVFSTGIIVLTVVSVILSAGHRRQGGQARSRSTPSACSPASPWPGPGMAKYHLNHREEPLAPAAGHQRDRRRCSRFIVLIIIAVVQVHRGGLGHPGHPARSCTSG